MGSALLDTTPGNPSGSLPAQPSSVALREQVAERLAAHRNRRAGKMPGITTPVPQASKTTERKAQIAASVAARYEKSTSYRAFLAAEAERAVQQAHAVAEIAAIQAQAIEAAQQNLLEELELEAVKAESELQRAKDGLVFPSDSIGSRLDRSAIISQELSLWPDAVPNPKLPDGDSPSARSRQSKAESGAKTAKRVARSDKEPHYFERAPTFAIRLESEVVLPQIAADVLRENRSVEEEPPALELDEEIAFRHAPLLDEFISRPQPLAANLIEFPRQLVAPRKARPRIAEGPLREDANEPATGQLRIFEVDAAQISTEPVNPHTATPQWTSIFLETAPASSADPVSNAPANLPGVAPMSRRIAAAAVNGCILAAAAAAFVVAAMVSAGDLDALRELSLSAVAHAILGHGPDTPGRALAGSAVIIALVVWIAYQALFFTFSTATPGMRCVRIALCTLGDENPSRTAIRCRALAAVLSLVPFGLGFAWTMVDEDRLSWHDRVSGIYQRTY